MGVQPSTIDHSFALLSKNSMRLTHVASNSQLLKGAFLVLIQLLSRMMISYQNLSVSKLQ